MESCRLKPLCAFAIDDWMFTLQELLPSVNFNFNFNFNFEPREHKVR